MNPNHTTKFRNLPTSPWRELSDGPYLDLQVFHSKPVKTLTEKLRQTFERDTAAPQGQR